MTSRPSIDHSILSPSGHTSKRARKAALKRTANELFLPGYWDTPPRTEEQQRQEKAVILRRSAETLRALAARGMSSRKYTKEAARLEAEANALEEA